MWLTAARVCVCVLSLAVSSWAAALRACVQWLEGGASGTHSRGHAHIGREGEARGKCSRQTCLCIKDTKTAQPIYIQYIFSNIKSKWEVCERERISNIVIRDRGERKGCKSPFQHYSGGQRRSAYTRSRPNHLLHTHTRNQISSQ